MRLEPADGLLANASRLSSGRRRRDERHALAGRLVSGMVGVPSRRPPSGLPHGRPRAELGEVGRQLRRGPPTAVRAVGLQQVDGMALASKGSGSPREHIWGTPRPGTARYPLTPRGGGWAVIAGLGADAQAVNERGPR